MFSYHKTTLKLILAVSFLANAETLLFETKHELSMPGGLVASSDFENDEVTMIYQNGQRVSYPLPVVSHGPRGIAVSADGRSLAVANMGTNDITVFQLTEGGILAAPVSFPVDGEAPVALAFSPDGKYLVSANNGSRSLTIFNVIYSSLLANGLSYSMPVHSPQPGWLEFSADGKSLLVAESAYSEEFIEFAVSDGRLAYQDKHMAVGQTFNTDLLVGMEKPLDAHDKLATYLREKFEMLSWEQQLALTVGVTCMLGITLLLGCRECMKVVKQKTE